MLCNSGWGKQGHAPCNILLLHQGLFLCQLNFMEMIQQSLVEVNLATLSFVDIIGFETVVSVCIPHYLPLLSFLISE